MIVRVNYKTGDKRTITADDIDQYKDHIEVYPVCSIDEPIDAIIIYKNEIKSVYKDYEWFGEKRHERIL